MRDPLGVLTSFDRGAGRTGRLYSLPALERKGFGAVGRLPVSLRVVLESLLRNLDGQRVTERDVRALAAWQPQAERVQEIPFLVSRVLLQDFTGVPLLVDLAAMRAALARAGKDPERVEPRVPVDLVVDHSVQVDAFGSPEALERNLALEFERNRERYAFLKWGTQAFKKLRIVPPGMGICHQVNLEFLATVVTERDGVFFPDTLVGTDSHTTMVNGLGVVGWGVGGIEAEAAMLDQPTGLLTPDVVGVYLHGALREGVTATDLVLTLTEMLRRAKVVGKFLEFHGPGAASLPVPERATIANMAPEYGATIGFFPVDERTLRYLAQTGRSPEQVEAVRAYCQAQGILGVPGRGDCDYSAVLELDLASVEPSVAGPKRPQDRVPLSSMKQRFRELFSRADATGYGKPAAELGRRVRAGDGRGHSGGGLQEAGSLPGPAPAANDREMLDDHPTPNAAHLGAGAPVELGHGDVVIAAITSCTNTSNPGVMLAAGLLAKKAVERGLSVPRHVKTSLAPGSRVVSRYLEQTGLQAFLDRLGFQAVGYGCTTCIGNSGPLEAPVEEAIARGDLVTAAVLSGNRNFEARIHQSVKANFLMSPPLVVAFALAGRVTLDLATEPLGTGRDGKPVFLREVWPTAQEVSDLLAAATDPEAYRRNYADFSHNARWNEMPVKGGTLYQWDSRSTYIQEPPYFFGEAPPPGDLAGARALAIFGDSVTTDHISPAGTIAPASPAGQYLVSQGVSPGDFNSYGSRRGNDRVMVRGTFANVRIRNLMTPGVEGGVTVHQPSGQRLSIYEAALEYEKTATPLLVLAGLEYGTGSSRDWAAKGTALLGVRAVVARSFERIHRSNLVGMGVLPVQLPEGVSAQSLGLDGSETFDLTGIGKLKARQPARLVIHRRDGRAEEVPVTLRVDTPVEVDHLRAGGILPYVLRQIAG
ncbi:MAG TPA: aconitate hydratase [Anaeromyxobacteraceae bacterium]|nr:aconitate hydratase [Anaeromyxobacteraceae bacterium]